MTLAVIDHIRVRTAAIRVEIETEERRHLAGGGVVLE
jgi:hypothetical protein